MKVPEATLVVRGGLLLDTRERRATSADLLVVGDTIRAIRPPGLAAPEGARLLDARDRLIIPGLVNGHMHGHGSLAKGMVGDRWPVELFLTWMPALAGNRTLEDKYLNGLLCAAEMIRKGCTACYDLFFEFPQPSIEGLEAVGRAYAEAGVRAVLAPMVADHTLYRALPGLIDAFPEPLRTEVDRFRLAPPNDTLQALNRIYDQWPCDRALVSPAIAPTIPLHCTDGFLKGCSDLARDYRLPLQTHLAESRAQAVLGLERYGRTLTHHLALLDVLGPNLSAAHAIWLDDDDLRRLADAGASIVHAPGSNMRFGSGLALVRPMLERGINVGIATDATNSSDNLNMFEATRIAAMVSRIWTSDHTRWLGADEVFHMATEGSARAMGLDQVGRLEVGWKADIVLLDLSHINWVPMHDPLTQLIFTENGASVDAVVVGGRVLMEQGKLLTIDEVQLRRRAIDAAARLYQTNAPGRAFAAQVEQIVATFCVGLARERSYHVHRHAPWEPAFSKSGTQ